MHRKLLVCMLMVKNPGLWSRIYKRLWIASKSLMSSSLCQFCLSRLSLISSRETDRQRDKQTNPVTQTPPSLAEIILTDQYLLRDVSYLKHSGWPVSDHFDTEHAGTLLTLLSVDGRFRRHINGDSRSGQGLEQRWTEHCLTSWTQTNTRYPYFCASTLLPVCLKHWLLYTNWFRSEFLWGRPHILH